MEEIKSYFVMGLLVWYFCLLYNLEKYLSEDKYKFRHYVYGFVLSVLFWPLLLVKKAVDFMQGSDHD